MNEQLKVIRRVLLSPLRNLNLQLRFLLLLLHCFYCFFAYSQTCVGSFLALEEPEGTEGALSLSDVLRVDVELALWNHLEARARLFDASGLCFDHEVEEEEVHDYQSRLDDDYKYLLSYNLGGNLPGQRSDVANCIQNPEHLVRVPRFREAFLVKID